MSEPGEPEHDSANDYEARASRRAQRLIVHRASSFAAADDWDLDFWQSRTPQERLTAFVHLRRDVELVRAARASADRSGA